LHNYKNKATKEDRSKEELKARQAIGLSQKKKRQAIGQFVGGG